MNWLPRPSGDSVNWADQQPAMNLIATRLDRLYAMQHPSLAWQIIIEFRDKASDTGKVYAVSSLEIAASRWSQALRLSKQRKADLWLASPSSIFFSFVLSLLRFGDTTRILRGDAIVQIVPLYTTVGMPLEHTVYRGWRVKGFLRVAKWQEFSKSYGLLGPSR